MKEYTIEDQRRHLILQCRYYNGEEVCPPEENGQFWFYEKVWVEKAIAQKENLYGTIKEYLFYGLADFEKSDGTPIGIKAILFNRYEHWVGYDNESHDGFKAWYRQHYQKQPTHKFIRAQQRRPGLIAKCRYYHGEEECPFITPKDSQPWEWEKEWVDALADSWTYRDKVQHEFVHSAELKPLNLSSLDMMRKRAESLKIPYTLYLHFAVRFGKAYVGGFKHEMEEYFDFWIYDYLKHKS